MGCLMGFLFLKGETSSVSVKESNLNLRFLSKTLNMSFVGDSAV